MTRNAEYWKKYKPWKNVGSKEWNDWNWQYHNLIRTVDELAEILPLTKEEVEAGQATKDEYKFSTTPYYATLIDPNNTECPIRLQTIPSFKEMDRAPADMRDPL